MQLTHFVIDLKRALSPDVLPDVLSAIRQDPLVWETLEDPDFAGQAISYAGKQPDLWSPASLSLLSLGQTLGLDYLRALPLQPLSPELRQQAAKTYEDTFRTALPPATLDKAGLLALALRERRRLTDTWQGLLSDLQGKSQSNPTLQLEVWSTPIACLYAMIPDQASMLKALLPAAPAVMGKEPIQLVLHAVLSNPLPLARQVQSLFDLLSGYQEETQVRWLEGIEALGHTALASQLAETFLLSRSAGEAAGKSPSIGVNIHGGLPPADAGDPILATEPLESLLARKHLAQYYLISGKSGQAIPVLNSLQGSLRHLQAAVALDLARAAAGENDSLTALTAKEQAHSLAPDSLLSRTSLAREYIRAGRTGDAAQLLTETPDHPLSSLAAAQLAAHSGNLAGAREHATRASHLVSEQSSGLKNSMLSGQDLIELARLLLDLNLYDEASHSANSSLKAYPADIQLLEILCRAEKSSGKAAEAAGAAYLAVSLSPEEPAYRRMLAETLEDVMDWEKCLEEREEVIRLAVTAHTPDTLALASSAIKAQRPDKAIEACSTVLSQNPDDGLAHTYLGEAHIMKGEVVLAVDHLTQATLLAPDLPLPWLDLANLYESIGDHRKSIETLHSASQAAPLSVEIHLALGQANLASGSPTEALPALRRAASLAPQSASVSLRLANTLYDLSRMAEAKQVLENARHHWPTHPDLAFAHAQTLLSLGEAQAALPALETALQANPPVAEPYIVYAHSLLAVSKAKAASSADPFSLAPVHSGKTADLQKAHLALGKALELEPENFEARLLMAEIQAAEGSLQEALNTYLELSEMDLAIDPRWSWRINFGMGKVALALNQMETSIAALQEAIQVKPDNLEIQQTLAEAYHAAALTEEAQIKGRTALGMAPHSIPNLVWYARMAVSMNDEVEAINALEHAIEIAPARTDLLLHLALVQKLASDKPAAQKTVKTLLILGNASAAEYQQAASLLFELNDPETAADCLQKALETSSGSPALQADLWAELADLQKKCGEPENALEAIQTALELRPDDPNLYFIHGDLLEAQNKNQAAASCFEQALALLPQPDGAKSAAGIRWNYVPKDLSPASLHVRLANLYRANGDLQQARQNAEAAVALAPERIDTHYNAANLSLALLDFQKANEYAAWPVEPDSSAADPAAALKLICLQAEVKFEMGLDEAAEAVLSQAKHLSAVHPRVLADFARLMARQGDFMSGAHALETALANLDSAENTPYAWENPSLPLAEAAMELQQWSTAAPLYQQAARSLHAEPFAQLSLARALVKAAESQLTCQILKASAHAPGEEVLSETAYQQFEKAIQAAGLLSDSAEITRWSRRGQAVFHPDVQSVNALHELSGNPEDAAALMLNLDQIGDQKIIPDIAARHIAHPAVILQMAAHSLQNPEEKTLPVLQAIANKLPGHPHVLALLAMEAQKEGDPAAAYQAMSSALAAWPDEPYWHASAAESAAQNRDAAASLEHWKKAANLDPDNIAFTHSYGDALLAAGAVDQAIQILETACASDPSRVEAWLSLANAYRAGGDYRHAIGGAEKAIFLAPGQVKPILASGEIALEAGQIELGLQRAKTALQMEPHSPRATWLLARSQTLLGHPAEALNTIETALPQLSEPYPVLVERTRLIRQVKGAQPALEALKELVEQYPEEPEGLGDYAKALAETGQREAAEKAAQSALLLQPDRPDLHLLLGRTQHASGQLDQSIHHLSEAIRLAPNTIDAYLELGKVHQDRREHNLAQKVYQQASAIAPSDARPYYQAGLTLKEGKDYISAETMLRKAADLAPEDLNIRRQLAAIIAINLVHKPSEAPLSK